MPDANAAIQLNKTNTKSQPLQGITSYGQVQWRPTVVASAVFEEELERSEADLTDAISRWSGYPRDFHPAHRWELK